MPVLELCVWLVCLEEGCQERMTLDLGPYQWAYSDWQTLALDAYVTERTSQRMKLLLEEFICMRAQATHTAVWGPTFNESRWYELQQEWLRHQDTLRQQPDAENGMTLRNGVDLLT